MSDLASEFTPDAPWEPEPQQPGAPQATAIDGVTVRPLTLRGDDRGSLCELITQREGPHEPIVHVYQVYAEPGSIRGWVYHRWQDDRLAFTQGRFQLALFDLRDGSQTPGQLVVLNIGRDNPVMVTIPPHVAHALKNSGVEQSAFVNLPTQVYDPANPDKARLPYPDQRIPFNFDE